METGRIEIEIDDVFKKFKDLTGPEMKRASKKAVREGASILKRETDRLYKSNTNLAGRKIKSTWKFKPGKSVISYDKRTGSFKVHIMKDFAMKWFEMGTDLRYINYPTTKLVYSKGKKFIIRSAYGFFKKRSSGRIKGLHLFMQAQNLTRDKIFSEMSLRLEKAINKIYDKKR